MNTLNIITNTETTNSTVLARHAEFTFKGVNYTHEIYRNGERQLYSHKNNAPRRVKGSVALQRLVAANFK